MHKDDDEKLKAQMRQRERTTQRYRSAVENKLKKEGIKGDPGLVQSLAKYYPVLRQLGRR